MTFTIWGLPPAARWAIPAMALMASAAVETAARAAVIDFSGFMTATASVVPDASCAPLPLRGTIAPENSVGDSAFGAFTYGHTVCITGATGPVFGAFTLFFESDQFHGTLTGQATANGDGTFTQIFDYVINGGTGRFEDAAGSFRGDGTVDPRNPPPRISFSFSPTNGVPEPATWATMLLGFVAIGAAMRRRASIAPHKLA